MPPTLALRPNQRLERGQTTIQDIVT